MFKFTGENLQLVNEMSEAVQFMCMSEDDNAINEVRENLTQALFSLGYTDKTGIIKALNVFSTNKETQSDFLAFFDRFYASALVMISNSFKTSVDYREGKYKCDKEFAQYVKTIKTNSHNKLCDIALNCLEKLKTDNFAYYDLITRQSKGWYFENNELDGVGGKNNSLIINRIAALKDNIEKIEEVYNVLQDNKSKSSLNAILHSWLTFDMSLSNQVCENSTRAFDSTIFLPYDNEVMVDCGSFTGDTVEEYIDEFGEGYKRIYTYDISKATVDILRQNLKRFKNIVANVKGVGEFKDTLSLCGIDGPFEGNKLTSNSGGETVPVVTLDEDISEEITFIKMDVEGLDKEALRGAKNHIVNDHPKIHVDCYHKSADFFEVPLLINAINPTYGFYLKITGIGGFDAVRQAYPTISAI